MTPAEHAAQRDLVARSLLLAATREERGEERPRRPRVVSPLPPVLAVPRAALAHVYRLPVVNERRPS